MPESNLRKIRCKTKGCHFVADLLPNGEAYDDIADKNPVKLYRNRDGTYECLACGAPIKAEPEDK